MTTSPSYSIGIDLSQHSFQVALARSRDDLFHWRQLPGRKISTAPNSPEGVSQLCEWLDQQAGSCERIVVESTGKMSHRFAVAMRRKGLADVVIVNPRRTKAFGNSLGVRDKTDVEDAAVLALYGAVHRPKPNRRLSPDEESLRELNRLRESYLTDLTAWKNRLEQTDDPEAREEIEQTLEHLKRQIERLEKKTQKKVDFSPPLNHQVRLLKQIKGIGPVTATTMTCELGDLTQYGRNELVATVGVFPRRYESGTSVHRRPRLAKGGGGRLRRVLYMGATSLMNSKGPMKNYIERLRARGMSDMCIIGVIMRKLLLIARTVMIQGGHYDETKIRFNPR